MTVFGHPEATRSPGDGVARVDLVCAGGYDASFALGNEMGGWSVGAIKVGDVGTFLSGALV